MTDFSPNRSFCPNCKNELHGQYCYFCGQNQKGYDRFFWSILNELFDDIFSKRSRVFLTLFYLLFRPGFLVVEYFSGRRARYVQPLKLYVLTSLIFFTLLSISNYFREDPELTSVISSESDGITEENLAVTDDNTVVADKNIIVIGNDKQQFEIDEALADFNIESFSEETNHLLKERLRTQAEKFSKDADASSRSFVSEFIQSAPLGLFLLVPVFALILKSFYLTSGLYYTQHLILAVYNHSFLFLVLSINIVLGLFDSASLSITRFLTTIFEYWTFIYIFLSLKVVYKQSIPTTIAKFLLLGLFYSILFIIIFIFLFLVNLLIL